MTELGGNVIELELSTNIEDKGVKVSPSEYLLRHTAIIVIDPNPNNPTPPNITYQDGNGGISIGWDNNEARTNSAGGSAAAITEDGYFLTAYHVVAQGLPWIVWTEQSADCHAKEHQQLNVSRKIGPIRIVYSNKKADFAIIKAPFDVSAFLEIRETKAERGEVLFSGGWLNETGAGRVKLTRSKAYEKHLFREMMTSIPLLEGDSGSPVIDQQGKLCAISSAAFAKISLVVNLEPSEIDRIIERDRIANKAVVGMPSRSATQHPTP